MHNYVHCKWCTFCCRFIADSSREAVEVGCIKQNFISRRIYNFGKIAHPSVLQLYGTYDMMTCCHKDSLALPLPVAGKVDQYVVRQDCGLFCTAD